MTDASLQTRIVESLGYIGELVTVEELRQRANISHPFAGVFLALEGLMDRSEVFRLGDEYGLSKWRYPSASPAMKDRPCKKPPRRSAKRPPSVEQSPSLHMEIEAMPKSEGATPTTNPAKGDAAVDEAMERLRDDLTRAQMPPAAPVEIDDYVLKLSTLARLAEILDPSIGEVLGEISADLIKVANR